MVIVPANKNHLLFGTLLGIHILYALKAIGNFPVDLDEPFTIFHATKSIPEIMALMWDENNPPLYFLLIHFWEMLVGIDQIPVRLLSFLLSCCSLTAIWYGSKPYLQHQQRFILGILFITSNFHHWSALETRAYSLFNLLIIILFFLWLKLITRSGDVSKRSFIYLGILNVLLFYTHYIHVAVIVAQIIVFIFYMKRHPLKYWFFAAITFCIGALPLLGIFIKRSSSVSSGGNWINQAHWTELYGLLIRFSNGHLAAITGCLIIALLFLIAIKKSIKLESQQRQILIITLVFSLLPYFLLFGLSSLGFVHLFYDKYLYFIFIPLCFTALFFIELIQIPTLLLASFVSLFVVGSNHIPETNRNGDQLAKFVQAKQPELTLISPHFYGLTFAYNYNQDLFLDKNLLVNFWKYNLCPFSEISQLPPLDARRIIYVDAHAPDTLVQKTQQLLQQKGYYLTEKKTFKGPYWVRIYQKNTKP